MILLDSKHIDRSLKRMTYQVLEEVRESPVHVVGLNKRGYLVAQRVSQILETISSHPFTLNRIHADDESSFEFEGSVQPDDTLLLVDDVIFSGNTMYRAMEKIGELSRFKKVLVMVLIDRGHRTIPVHAEIVGMHVPTKLNEHIELVIKNNKPEKITLTK